MSHNTKDSGSVFDPKLTLLRLKRPEFLVVYISLIILTILYLIVVFCGENTPWYLSLTQSNINPWLIRGLWVVATILSYVTFFFIWQDIRVYNIPRDFIVSVLFLITNFLFLGWTVSLYYGENLYLSFWIAFIIFIYNFWLFVYVWKIKPFASLFLIPSLILYLYLIYSTLHLASLNHITI
jgi:tryptophan-rich sensory protein